MRSSVHLADALPRHMRVELRRADTRMTEQLLDDAQVSPSLQEVGGEGVAQGVWADPVRQPGGGGRAFHGTPGLVPGPSATSISDEQGCAAKRRYVAEREQRDPRSVDPVGEHPERDVPYWYKPLLVALSDDPDKASVH